MIYDFLTCNPEFPEWTNANPYPFQPAAPILVFYQNVVWIQTEFANTTDIPGISSVWRYFSDQNLQTEANILLTNTSAQTVAVTYQPSINFIKFANSIVPTSNYQLTITMDTSSANLQPGFTKKIFFANNSGITINNVGITVLNSASTFTIYNSMANFPNVYNNSAIYFEINVVDSANLAVIFADGSPAPAEPITNIVSLDGTNRFTITGTGDITNITSSDGTQSFSVSGAGPLTEINSQDSTWNISYYN